MMNDDLDLDLLAAQLRAQAGDLSMYAAFLLTVLAGALPPELVEVRREGRLKARLAGRREPAVTGVSVRLGTHRFELDRPSVGAPPVAAICHESGGVVLSTTRPPIAEWSRALAAALADTAGQHATAIDVLRRLTEP
jgi:hypothetical protein